MLNNQHVVLVVEDNCVTLGFLTRFFCANGMYVKAAANVPEAISRLDSNVDIIVTDFDMPILNGQDLCMMAKSKFNIPVVMITGLRDLDPEALLKHCDTVVYKPIQPKTFLQVIKNLLFAYVVLPG